MSFEFDKDCFKAGYAAFEAGTSITANPYVNDASHQGDYHNSWEEGWFQARLDAARRTAKIHPWGL